MRTNTPSLEDYWTTLARVLPAFSADQQRTVLTLYRELAKGTPVATERVASALGVTPEQAAAELAREPLRAFVYADQGQILSASVAWPSGRCNMNFG